MTRHHGAEGFEYSEALERNLAAGNVAAVVLEPIQVGAGIIIPSDSYLPRVQELVHSEVGIAR